MEENRGAYGDAIRLEEIGTIPVLRKMARIDRAAVEIAIGGHAVFGSQFLSYLGSDVLKDGVFSLQKVRPISLIEFVDAQPSSGT